MGFQTHQLGFVCLLFLLQLIPGVPGTAAAGSLTVEVSTDKGKPLESAVVMLTPQFSLAKPLPDRKNAEMHQQNILFSPFVLPIKVGTNVSFPNLDESRHHVYSFSKAKRFELRLYGKDETNSVNFDAPGIVALGCNIHDNMLAYIYVTEAPIFLTTGADGTAAFPDLEDGAYEITAWHPGVRRDGTPEARTVNVGAGTGSEKLSLRLRRVWGEQREPEEGQY